MTELITSGEAKALPLEDLQDIFAPFDFKTEPRKHQYSCLAFGMDRQRLALWLDIGTGKTLTALYLTKIWRSERILVVCPKSVMRKTWVPEINAHCGWTYRVLSGTVEQRKAELARPARV